MKEKITITPELKGLGGMVSFQAKFLKALEERGIQHSFDLNDAEMQNLLIVGGSRKAFQIGKERRKALYIVQRLDGINWLHRKMRTGIRHWMRAESGNYLLKKIRNELADQVVYQSQFVRDWWHAKHGPSPGRESVIHNGVDLKHFAPNGKTQRDDRELQILMVEGNIEGGYEIGLDTGVELVNALRSRQKKAVSLSVAGKASQELMRKAEEKCAGEIKWLGVLANSELPEHYRRAHMLYSADLNAACPNSVIEAMACGLPIVAFNTGALPELVDKDSGVLADYGGDAWELDPPNIVGLADAAKTVFEGQASFRKGARKRAEKAFSLGEMTDKYLEVLFSA